MFEIIAGSLIDLDLVWLDAPRFFLLVLTSLLTICSYKALISFLISFSLFLRACSSSSSIVVSSLYLTTYRLNCCFYPPYSIRPWPGGAVTTTGKLASGLLIFIIFKYSN